jgi:arylsulfatase A-like enzyme
MTTPRHRPRSLAFGLAAVLAFTLQLAGCGDAPDAASVVLVSIDTLRPDHLGCYGYHRDTSPAIDELRRDAVLFSEAFAPAPSTLPSHASLFSSLLPQHHGASMTRSVPLPETVLTLAEVLQAAGYRTAAFTGAGQLHSAFGFGQGFEVYHQPVADLAGAVDEATRWLDGLSGEPFFVFLHTYEVHHPYDPELALLEQFAPDYDGELPAEISVELLRRINDGELELSEQDLDLVVSAYDAEIREMDRSLGRLLEQLRARGLYEESMIVLTSDHGEEFGEHGWVGWHSHTLYDELLRVPLIVKLPGGRSAGTTIEAPARLIDVAPTITEVAGAPIPPDFDGVDLLGERPPSEVPIVAMIDHGSNDFEALRLRHWKWFAGRLFDLRTDPRELTDLAMAKPEVAAQLEARLRKLVGERQVPVAEAIEPDEETLEQLRALGYLQ